MTVNEINKFSAWYLIDETTIRMMQNIKEKFNVAEIKGLDDFKLLLEKGVRLITDRIEELSGKEEAQMSYQMIYNYILNKYLFLISTEMIYFHTKIKENQPTFSIHINYEGENNYRLNKHSFNYWLKGELSLLIMFTEYTKSINTVWLRAWFDNIQKNKFDESFNKKMIEPLKSSVHQVKTEFIKAITKKKNELRKKNPGKKISVSAVARELNIPDTTFRERIKDYKITFSDL